MERNGLPGACAANSTVPRDAGSSPPRIFSSVVLPPGRSDDAQDLALANGQVHPFQSTDDTAPGGELFVQAANLAGSPSTRAC